LTRLPTAARVLQPSQNFPCRRRSTPAVERFGISATTHHQPEILLSHQKLHSDKKNTTIPMVVGMPGMPLTGKNKIYRKSALQYFLHYLIDRHLWERKKYTHLREETGQRWKEKKMIHQ